MGLGWCCQWKNRRMVMMGFVMHWTDWLMVLLGGVVVLFLLAWLMDRWEDKG